MSVEIGKFEAPEVENPYTGTVNDLLAAGEDAAATITVPTKDAKKTRFKFSKAANKIGKTARVRISTDDAESGTTKIVFTLTDKHKARRRKDTTATDSKNAKASK